MPVAFATKEVTRQADLVEAPAPGSTANALGYDGPSARLPTVACTLEEAAVEAATPASDAVDALVEAVDGRFGSTASSDEAYPSTVARASTRVRKVRDFRATVQALDADNVVNALARAVATLPFSDYEEVVHFYTRRTCQRTCTIARGLHLILHFYTLIT